MIDNLITGAAWLENSVPLWAFLIALLTSPAEWTERVSRAIDARIGDEPA